jgi:hypothetical protein
MEHVELWENTAMLTLIVMNIDLRSVTGILLEHQMPNTESAYAHKE